MKEKKIYSEIYKIRMKIKKNYFPILNHLTQNQKRAECIDVEILESGLVNRDGKDMEYQILKIYYK